MSNLFSGIITPAVKQLHKDMIDALLEDEACTVLCILHFASKFTDCPNCLINTATGKSANKYTSGGPIQFSDGQICPYCQGQGKIQEPQSEQLYLMPIWSSKDWMKVPTAKIDLQTMSKITTYDNLKRCTSITADSINQRFGVPDLIREGDPEILGFGAGNFVITSWKRI